MDECVQAAKRLAERVGRELEIPVFLYARAAQRPERERLPDIRKGEFEGLRERLGRDPAADPDFGPRQIHPTAGATAIGARPFLVAFNVYLDTPDVTVAKEIAKRIRTSSGGLPAVQASGFAVDGMAQVSMNLLDIDETPPTRVIEEIERQAEQRRVKVVKSEIVGLIPARAVLGTAADRLRLADDPAAHLLEAKIREAEGPTLDGFLEELASAAPVPGGGSAAALAGTVAGALVAMVARLTSGRAAYAAVEPRTREILAEAEGLRAELRRLVEEDAAAYARVRTAYQLPKTNAARQGAIDAALLGAAEPPIEVARRAARLLELAREIGTIGNPNAKSDAVVAELLARAALLGAAENVRANVVALSEPARGKELLLEAERLSARP